MNINLSGNINFYLLKNITLLVFCSSTILQAQQNKIDSLKILISKTKNDTDKVKLYSKLGDAYYLEKKMDSSVLSFQQSIKLNEKNNISLLLLCWSTAALDYRLYEMGNYIESLNYAVRHLELSEKLNDTSQQGAAHLVFGDDYKALGYYREALNHFFKARKFYKLYWENRIGKEDNTYTFLCIAETYLKMNRLDSALRFTQMAYKIAVQNSDGGLILLSIRLTGDISVARGDDETALKYYRQYITDFVKYHETNRDLGFVLNNVAKIFQKKGEIDSAIFYAGKALKNAQQYGDQQNLFTAGMLLSDYYEETNHSAAFSYLKIAMLAKDSMSSSEKLKRAQILLFNEQVREKQKAQADAKEAARLRIIIIITAIIILIGSFLIWNRIRQLRLKYKMILDQKESEKLRAEYNLNKAQVDRQIVELEAKALRSQMNPHFIFNCMNSIKSLIQKNEQDKAINYLTTFSKLIRTIFQNSDKREISLHDEIETCKLYTQLENMRLKNKFSYEFNIDETIDMKSVMVPALIIQPFIENAIWHGIMPKEEGGTVQITVSKKDNKIFCVVDDNGIGREVSMQNKFYNQCSTHESKGIRLTQARLNINNYLNVQNATVEIINKTNDASITAGTKVILTFYEELLTADITVCQE